MNRHNPRSKPSQDAMSNGKLGKEKYSHYGIDVLGVLVVRWRVGHLVRIGFAEGVTNSRLERKKKKKG